LQGLVLAHPDEHSKNAIVTWDNYRLSAIILFGDTRCIQNDLHSRTGWDEKKGKTQEKMERGSGKRSLSARSEKMEKVSGR